MANPTSQSPQRSVKGAPDTTKPATLTASKPRTPTHAVQGAPAIENGKTMATPSGPPPLHGTGAPAVKPKEQK